MKMDLRNKVDIITRGVKIGLPESIIEKQLNLFKTMNEEESYYTIKDGKLYKVIPCQ